MRRQAGRPLPSLHSVREHPGGTEDAALRRGRRHATLAYTPADLAACSLLLLAGALLVGQHTTSFAQLKADLADGEPSTVKIADDLHAGATGYVTGELLWRDGLFWQRASVLQGHGGPGVQHGAADQADVSTPIAGDVASQLREINPRVRIIRTNLPTSGGSIVGWQVPTWMALTALALFLVTVGLLTSGPQPWRATRWAWFWLIVSPLGTLSYLLLSGPTPSIPAPRDPRRRLAGGWAFLLSIPLGALLVR